VACAGHNALKEMISPSALRRIIVAPDSFKGSLTAAEAAVVMAEGVHLVLPAVTTVLVPISDGGEGLVDVLRGPLNAVLHTVEVSGPLPGQRVEARWAFCPARRLAILEMAEAAGLALVPPRQRDPKRTTTYGVGQMIWAALESGAEEILIGIGGSATNDGGVGMAMALGVRFLDAAGNAIPEGGGGLASLASIDLDRLDPRIRQTKITVACDVTNPLTGSRGASVVYGPQKGATFHDVILLERGLERLAEVLQRETGIDIRGIAGSGAAGGLGGGLVGFCGAVLRPGIDLVLDLIGFDEIVKGADLILTGEGRLDVQLRFGKALAGLLRRAKGVGVPVVGVVGSVEGDVKEYIEGGGFAALAALVSEDVTLEGAMADAGRLLRQRTAELILRLAAQGLFERL
jgi:glycerate kinase